MTSDKITEEEEFEREFENVLSENEFVKLGEALHDLADVMINALIEVVEAVVEKVVTVYDVIYTAYVEDGAKYGECHDGLMRWIKEKADEVNEEEDTP